MRRAAGQGQILTGLAQSPAAGASIDLSGLPGQVNALAFDGQNLILGVASGEAGGIYLASASAGVQRIAPGASPSAIALAGSSLYFADNQSQQVFQVQNYAGTPGAVVFASDSGISSPDGLQVSADGQRLFVANAASRKLDVYDIASRAPVQSLDLAFTPTGVERFGDASVFLLNGSGPRTSLCRARRRRGEGCGVLRTGTGQTAFVEDSDPARLGRRQSAATRRCTRRK